MILLSSLLFSGYSLPPPNSRTSTTHLSPGESILSRFSVVFESFSSRFRVVVESRLKIDSKTTQKRAKNDSKSTRRERGQWWGSISRGDRLELDVDGLRLSTPTNPQGAPPLGWRHDGVVCVVLEFQSGNAILAQVQGTCLG